MQILQHKHQHSTEKSIQKTHHRHIPVSGCHDNSTGISHLRLALAKNTVLSKLVGLIGCKII